MNTHVTADAVRVSCDEDGFHLLIDTDDGDHIDVNVHAIADSVLEAVDGTIRPWVAERDNVRRAFDAHRATGCCTGWVYGEGPCALPRGHEGHHDATGARVRLVL